MVRAREPITVRPERWKYTPPKLINGDRLSLAEFNYLYKNSPHIRRAELSAEHAQFIETLKNV